MSGGVNVRAEVAADMTESARDFDRIVWPSIKAAVGGGELIPVESVSASGFAAKLDQIAGIDAWIVQRDMHMFGLASRVQWNVAYKTFTIRMRRPNGATTEYEKRKAQIATSGSVYPKWTCQAYVKGGALLTAAMATTKDVIAAVSLGIGYERTAYDGVKFWVVPWADLWNAGCRSLHVLDADGLHSRGAA